MRESNFQTLFTKWLKEKWQGTGAFELKICKKKSLPFSAVKEHQINALKAVKDRVHVHKISDFSPGLKPYDCYSLAMEKAFIAVMFYVPRQPKGFYLIDVDDFLELKIDAKRKSFTEDMVSKSYGTNYFKL